MPRINQSVKAKFRLSSSDKDGEWVVFEELPNLHYHLTDKNVCISQMVMQARQFPSRVDLLMGLVLGLWSRTDDC